MKKIIVFILSVGVFFNSYSQQYDDRLVTSHLQVNPDQDHFADYINGFREGLAKAKAGEFSSLDAVASLYNVEIRNYPSLDERLADAASGTAMEQFSVTFITNLKNVVKNAGQYTSIRDLRNEYVKMAVSGALSVKEAEALALLDISTQEIEKSLVGHDGSSRIHEFPVGGIYTLTGLGIDDVPLDGGNWIRPDKPLPRWLICGLGAIGSAIMGAISGAGTGAQVGALFGAAGAASGAIIGGVAGFIGGAAVGIARYCQ